MDNAELGGAVADRSVELASLEHDSRDSCSKAAPQLAKTHYRCTRSFCRASALQLDTQNSAAALASSTVVGMSHRAASKLVSGVHGRSVSSCSGDDIR